MRALIAPILAVALVLALTVPTALASHQSLRPSPAGVRALADPAVVTISGAGATPQVLTVDAGTAVQWLNHDSITHTITADDGSFGPLRINVDDQSAAISLSPGAHDYHIDRVNNVTGTIVVRDNAQTSTPTATITPVATSSPTSPASATAPGPSTATASATASPTATDVVEPTAGADVPSATALPTATNTPTTTPSSTATLSPTVTPSPPASLTATNTPSGTATPTATGTPPAATVPITIDSATIDPAVVTMTEGMAAQWTNLRTSPVTVTQFEGFSVGPIAPRTAAGHQFALAGSYLYYVQGTKLSGLVVVQPAGLVPTFTATATATAIPITPTGTPAAATDIPGPPSSSPTTEGQSTATTTIVTPTSSATASPTATAPPSAVPATAPPDATALTTPATTTDTPTTIPIAAMTDTPTTTDTPSNTPTLTMAPSATTTPPSQASVTPTPTTPWEPSLTPTAPPAPSPTAVIAPDPNPTDTAAPPAPVPSDTPTPTMQPDATLTPSPAAPLTVENPSATNVPVAPVTPPTPTTGVLRDLAATVVSTPARAASTATSSKRLPVTTNRTTSINHPVARAQPNPTTLMAVSGWVWRGRARVALDASVALRDGRVWGQLRMRDSATRLSIVSQRIGRPRTTKHGMLITGTARVGRLTVVFALDVETTGHTTTVVLTVTALHYHLGGPFHGRVLLHTMRPASSAHVTYAATTGRSSPNTRVKAPANARGKTPANARGKTPTHPRQQQKPGKK